VADSVTRFGRLDILVNNAGLGTNHDALEATEAEWDDPFAVNVRAPHRAAVGVGGSPTVAAEG
jgi:NAD(P)-dependent dehydrogenase (short-subunit alcohol dehydrogenase family)